MGRRLWCQTACSGLLKSRPDSPSDGRSLASGEPITPLVTLYTEFPGLQRPGLFLKGADEGRDILNTAYESPSCKAPCRAFACLHSYTGVCPWHIFRGCSIILASALTAAGLFSASAFAGEGGSCHFHGSKPATEAVVNDCADKRRDALVKAGKLDASWLTAKREAVALIDGKKGKEWKVSFKNPGRGRQGQANAVCLFLTPR